MIEVNKANLNNKIRQCLFRKLNILVQWENYDAYNHAIKYAN